MIDINTFLQKNNKVFILFSHKYHNNYDFDDFKQELMIEVWKYMEKYDPSKNDNPQAYLFCCIDMLARRVLKKFNSDKVSKFNDSFCAMINDYLNQETVADAKHIDMDQYNLTEMEKRIIYCIDYDTTVKINSIAEKLGVSPRMLYYYIKNIRKKLGKS